LWSHVDAMCGMLMGYGLVALKHLTLLPVSPSVLDIFADVLDPGLDHLPPVSHQSFVQQTLWIWDVGGWLIYAAKNWDQEGHGKQDPAPLLELVNGCCQPRWYCTPMGMTVICCPRVQWWIAPC